MNEILTQNPVITFEKIQKIIPHNNADSLELAIIGKWPVCVAKGQFTEGEEVVYFQIDCLLPQPLAEELGVWKYLHLSKRFLDAEGFPMGKVVAAKLRGKPSYGFIVKKNQVPENIEELVSKWTPPETFNCNDAEKENTLFHKYLTIPNLRNDPGIFEDGEPIIITEKIHGMNARFGLVNNEFMCGSHNVRLRESASNKFWFHFSEDLKGILKELSASCNSEVVIAFGELYGDGIQDLKYGLNGKTLVRIFDISINGNYLPFHTVKTICEEHNIYTVPELGVGNYDLESIVNVYENSKTYIGNNIMEGVVIRSIDGNKIGKYVFDQYLTRKKGTEYK